jgi:hypothetical protein
MTTKPEDEIDPMVVHEKGKLWEEFAHWEREHMLARGSGMTADQITGAGIFLDWLVKRQACKKKT